MIAVQNTKLLTTLQIFIIFTVLYIFKTSFPSVLRDKLVTRLQCLI